MQYMIYIETLAISLLINIFLFVPAYFLKTDKLTDFSYGLSFILLSVYLFLNSAQTWVDTIVMIMVLIWAIRLITYLLVRIMKIGKDNRFDKIRNNPVKFMGFWIAQGITVWVVMLSSIGFLGATKEAMIVNLNNINFDIFLLGIIVYLIGLIIESVADYQKFKFKLKPENKGLWISSGLWKFSRHPNYFGEILIWLGVYITTISNINYSSLFIGIISPIFIFVILRFFSGIPPLEKRYNERYSDNIDYKKYKDQTNLLILGRPRPDSIIINK